jgi:hypothetical protein
MFPKIQFSINFGPLRAGFMGFSRNLRDVVRPYSFESFGVNITLTMIFTNLA